MSEAIITVLNTAWELVENRISELGLRKNLSGQYDHDDITTLKKGIGNVLGSRWNALEPGKGANMLLGKEPNLLTKTKKTDVIDTNSVVKTSKEEAVTVNTAVEEDATPVTVRIAS